MAEEVLEGQRALDLIKIRLDGLAVVPTRLPSVSIEDAVAELKVVLDSVGGDREVLIAIYNEAIQAQIRGQMEDLKVLRVAALHAIQHYDRITSLSGADLAELRREGRVLQLKGFEMLKQLVLLGLISKGEEKIIRRGTGSVDMAGDLNVMGHLGQTHFGVIEKIEALKADGSARLTRADLARMIALSLLVVVGEGDDASVVDWRDVSIRCWALLHSVWEPTRNLLGAALRHVGDDARADAMKSLYGLAH